MTTIFYRWGGKKKKNGDKLLNTIAKDNNNMEWS